MIILCYNGELTFISDIEKIRDNIYLTIERI